MQTGFVRKHKESYSLYYCRLGSCIEAKDDRALVGRAMGYLMAGTWT